MKQVLKYTGYFLILFIVGYLLWRFSYIIVWVLLAAMVSFMGQPLVEFFDRIRFWKIKMPRPLSALLALLIIILLGAGFVALFVPLIISQAEAVAKIDVAALARNLEGPMEWLDEKLHNLGTLPDGQSLEEFLALKVKNLINIEIIGTTIGKFVTAAGNIFIGLFSIIFISFFFLKDENLFQEGLLIFVPEKYHEGTKNVVSESKTLLVRYYLGVMLQIFTVMLLIALGLKIFGIKNALLIGFFGGLMNIIPYIGPVIGGVIGVTLGGISTLSAGSFNDLFPVVLKILGTLVVVNFIDNNILVPVIYSRSVKSHPLEIFIVIIVGGGVAGLVGMLFAVPAYTLLRVIAREFFQEFRVVKRLTKKIDDA